MRLETPNAKRVATMYLCKDAGLYDYWETYVKRPIQTLVKRAPELKDGPMDDVIDDVLRDIAPLVSEAVQKQMIQITFDEFEAGAFAGAKDAIDGRLPAVKGKNFYPKYNCPRDCDWGVQGYLQGYQNPGIVASKGLTDRKLKKTVLKAIQAQEEDDLAENVVFDKLYGIWQNINPVNLVKMTIKMVKQYGWKIGVGIALVQAIETFVIPAIATGLGAPPPVAAALSQLPITEIVLPIAAKTLGIEVGDPPVITDDVDEFLAENPDVKLGSTMSNTTFKDVLREVRNISKISNNQIRFSDSSPYGNIRRRRKMAIDRTTIYEIDNIMGFIWAKWLKGDDKKLFKNSAKEVARILIEERGMTDEEAIEYVQKVASWTERMEDWATD